MDRDLLERLSKPRMLLIFTIVYLIAAFFIANFSLSFFQEIILVFQRFVIEEAYSGFSVSWKSMFHFQGSLIEYYVAFYFITGIGLMKFIYNMRLNYQTLDTGQHGTSEFESVTELKKQYTLIPAKDEEYKGEGGVIIAGYQSKFKPYRLLIDEGPIHTMVIGITRSGKGETFVFPMIDVLSRAEKKASLVINDPKGELAAASYDTLIERGYEVHVFNLIQQHMSMGFNPLQIVIDAWQDGKISDAQSYASGVAFSLYNDPNAKDPFWSNSAKSLVTAIILALSEDSIATGKEEIINMYSVANFLSTLGSDNDEDAGTNALDLFFQARSETNPARMMYATSNFAAGNTRSSIFSVAMDKLQIFTLEPNAKLTSFNSIKVTDVGFGEKPVAIFLVTPDFDASNHILASIFVSQLYRINAQRATMSPGGKMARHVHFLLDEFGNMPTVDGMAGMVTVGAGRGFRFHLVVQAYSQLKASYGEDAETIIGNCSNQIYILTKDKATADQYSALIGSKGVMDVNRSGRLLSSDKSHSESIKERPLMMADELMQLKEGESVVVRANKRQDNNRNKIKPKPIFNTGATAAKFRWEYLADSFDNSKSILELPIMSRDYNDMDLSQVVFTSKSEKDMYIKMRDAMGLESFQKLNGLLMKGLARGGPLINIEDWSFLQLFSYLAYDSRVINVRAKVELLKLTELYLPKDIIRDWEIKINESQSRKKKFGPDDEREAIMMEAKGVL